MNGKMEITLLEMNGKINNMNFKDYYSLFLENRNNEYLLLAKNPKQNNKKLQKLVNEKAQSQGYSLGPFFHGSKSIFNNFDLKRSRTSDPGLSGKGFYFTANRQEAENISLINQYGKGDTPHTYSVYINSYKQFPIISSILPNGQTIRDLHGGISITNEGGSTIREMAEKHNCDSIVFKSKDHEIRHIMVWDSTKIKLSVPVTYDDVGNVIPLSSRFDLSKDDIRY